MINGVGWSDAFLLQPNRMTDMGLMPELEVHQSRDHEDVKIRDYEDVKTARYRLCWISLKVP